MSDTAKTQAAAPSVNSGKKRQGAANGWAKGKKRPRNEQSVAAKASGKADKVCALTHIRGKAAVIATCDTGKERQALKELLALLEESANELYPPAAAGQACGKCPSPSCPVTLCSSTCGACGACAEKRMSSVSEHGCHVDTRPIDAGSEDEGQDTTASSSSSGGGAAASIEEQIKAEASAVRAAGTADRFVSVKVDLSGLLVICVTDPSVANIVAVVQHLCSQIAQKRERRARFLVRLSPLTDTCYGDLENFTTLAQAAVPPCFEKLSAHSSSSTDDPTSSSNGSSSSDGSVKWAVQLTRRHSGVPRTAAINMLGGLVTDKRYSVDLSNPDVVIIAEALRGVIGLSVVTDYRARGYNGFNLRALQEQHCGKGLDSTTTATADTAEENDD